SLLPSVPASGVSPAGPVPHPSHSQRPAQPARVALGLIVKLKSEDEIQAKALPQSRQTGGRAADARQISPERRAERLARLAMLAGYPSTMRWVATGTEAMAHMAVPTPLTREQAARVIERLQASGEVAWAEPNVREPLHQAAANPAVPPEPNDPDLLPAGAQWWARDADAYLDAPTLGVPNLRGAWAVHRGASSGQVVVAVLDTGVLPDAPELAGRLLPGYDFVSDAQYDHDKPSPARDSDASDPGDWVSAEQANNGCQVSNSSWHGTSVSGLIAAAGNNGLGG